MTYQDFLGYVEDTKSDIYFPIVNDFDAAMNKGFYGLCVGICEVPKDEKAHFLNYVNVRIKRLYVKTKKKEIPGKCDLCECEIGEWCDHEVHYYCCHGGEFTYGSALEKDEGFNNWKNEELISFNSKAVINCHQVKLVAWVLAAVCGYDDEVIREVNKIKDSFTRAKKLRSILYDYFSSNT